MILKDKICPLCENKAVFIPLLDPYKETKQKNRLKLYDYACGTVDCYLENGAGQYVTKEDSNIIESMWMKVPDYVVKKKVKKDIIKSVSKDKKQKGRKYKIHFSTTGIQSNVVCSSRDSCKDWTNDIKKVDCPRCTKTEIMQYLFKSKTSLQKG